MSELLFRSQKMSKSLEKPKSEFPTLCICMLRIPKGAFFIVTPYTPIIKKDKYAVMWT